jgi:two-component system LytT family sensor kinase
MYKKQNIYWSCQLIGWLFYTAINLFFFKLSYKTNALDVIIFLLWFPLGLSITHLYRAVINKLTILNSKILFQLPFIVFSSFLMSFIFFVFNVFIIKLFSDINYQLDYVAAISKILSLMLIFIIWSVIYFGFHYFDNYKKTEIQNLKLEANKNEIELNTLKSQLNPHFMFNSLNSIRALVDEDPKKAKTAITQLSNILRNTLMMHKNKFIAFEEEIKLVTDYLALEHIRYEERLTFDLDIDPKTLQIPIPPMMIQTLVENAIKHGISHLVDGGEIIIKATLEDDTFKISVKNTGQIISNITSLKGVGVENTTNRLQILYGNKAKFKLENFDDKNVITEVSIKL